jgi:predicted permease
VLVLIVLGSAALTLGTWEHRHEWMGATFLFVVAPGAVALYVLARKLFGEWELLKRSRK